MVLAVGTGQPLVLCSYKAGLRKREKSDDKVVHIRTSHGSYSLLDMQAYVVGEGEVIHPAHLQPSCWLGESSADNAIVPTQVLAIRPLEN